MTTMSIKIAIPVDHGRLNSHFGGSREFAIVEADPDTKAIVRTTTLAAPEHQPGVFPRWLQSLGVEVVLVGGIGQRAVSIFTQHGIHVRAGSRGATIEQLVAAYLAGELDKSPEPCAHHEHHSHGGDPEHPHGQGHRHP